MHKKLEVKTTSEMKAMNVKPVEVPKERQRQEESGRPMGVDLRYKSYWR